MTSPDQPKPDHSEEEKWKFRPWFFGTVLACAWMLPTVYATYQHADKGLFILPVFAAIGIIGLSIFLWSNRSSLTHSSAVFFLALSSGFVSFAVLRILTTFGGERLLEELHLTDSIGIAIFLSLWQIMMIILLFRWKVFD